MRRLDCGVLCIYRVCVDLYLYPLFRMDILDLPWRLGNSATGWQEAKGRASLRQLELHSYVRGQYVIDRDIR